MITFLSYLLKIKFIILFLSFFFLTGTYSEQLKIILFRLISYFQLQLIAASTLYLAGKVKDDPLKIRDIINVAHNTLHRGSSPLEIGDEYWNMRDAIVQAELLIMRILKFEVSIVHPHKFMLHYLRSMDGWLGKEQCNTIPIARTAASFLQDYHHDPSILEYPPQHVAVACISLALQCYGIRLPLIEDNDDEAWYSIFVKDLQKDKHWEIMEKVMEVYNREPEIVN